MKIKEIKATGKYVVIKVKEVAMSIETKTKSGIILQTENTDGQKINNKTNTGKVRGKFIIDSIEKYMKEQKEKRKVQELAKG